MCVVAHLGAVGRPLDERVAHRAGRIAELASVQAGAAIDVPLMVALLAHPQAGLKGIPPQARRVAVLTQSSGEPLRLDTAPILAALIERGYDAAFVVDLGLAEPVLAARA